MPSLRSAAARVSPAIPAPMMAISSFGMAEKSPQFQSAPQPKAAA
jgi:hypothetical protein